MAVGYDRRTTDPAQFEEELAAVSAQDQAEMQRAQDAEDREQMYAQQMDEQNNQQRQQSRVAAAIQQKAKDVVTKKAKKWLFRYGSRALIAYVGWIPIAVILGIVLIIVIAVAILNYSCNSDSNASWLVRMSSSAASFFGITDFDICAQFGMTMGTNASTAGTISDRNNSMSSNGDAEARAFLALYHISINKPCINPDGSVANPPGQTCLTGILQSTLDEVMHLKTACDQWAARTNRPREMTPGPNLNEADSYCEVIVTGGTEQGHATQSSCIHSKGFKIDLSLRPNLNAFIETNYPRIANRGADAQYRNSAAETSYFREGDHWDVSVGCA